MTKYTESIEEEYEKNDQSWWFDERELNIGGRIDVQLRVERKMNGNNKVFCRYPSTALRTCFTMTLWMVTYRDNGKNYKNDSTCVR